MGGIGQVVGEEVASAVEFDALGGAERGGASDRREAVCEGHGGPIGDEPRFRHLAFDCQAVLLGEREAVPAGEDREIEGRTFTVLALTRTWRPGEEGAVVIPAAVLSSRVLTFAALMVVSSIASLKWNTSVSPASIKLDPSVPVVHRAKGLAGSQWTLARA